MILCFTGAHYLALIRCASTFSPNRTWHLFNDQSIELIGCWKDVVKFLIESNCVPTLVMYEKYELNRPVSESQCKNIDAQLGEEDLLMMYLTASEQEQAM